MIVTVFFLFTHELFYDICTKSRRMRVLCKSIPRLSHSCSFVLHAIHLASLLQIVHEMPWAQIYTD